MKTNDLDSLLHQEIERLPERYRAPLVLCDLEGCSHQQAARHLGLPLGTVKSRQARGRERLRDRLRRRSLAPNATLLGSGRLLTGPNPVVSPGLVESTTRSVVQFVTCQAAVPASTLALSHEVLKAMSVTRWLKAASVLLVVGATVSGAGMFAQRRAPAAPLPTTNSAKEAARTNLSLSGSPQALSSSRSLTAAGWNLQSITTYTVTLKESRPSSRSCPRARASRRDRSFVRSTLPVCAIELINARIAITNAEVDFQNATAAREVAEMSVKEYMEGTYKNELASAKGEVAAAESAIQQARRRLDRARRAQKRLDEVIATRKGNVAPADIVAELDIEDRLDASEQSIAREKTALELAQSRQQILEEYTRDKTIKALKLEVERSRPEELRQTGALAARAIQGEEARKANRFLHDQGASRRQRGLCD